MSTAAVLPPLGDEVTAAIADGHAAVDRILASVASTAGAGRDWKVPLTELERLGRRVEAARLRIISRAEQDGAAESAGFADTGSWVSRHTQQNQREAALDAAVALELGDGPAQLDGDEDGTLLSAAGDAGSREPAGPTEPRRTATGRALDRGDISAEHAKVIVQALRDLPDTVDAPGRERCEAELLRLAANRTPAKLRIAARRVLETVSPDPAEVDAHEDAVVTTAEDRAWEGASFWVKDNHDGTMTGQFTVPWLPGAQLKKVIDAMTAPRRRTGALAGEGRTDTASTDGVGWKAEQLDWKHRRGVAFAELLGHLPTDHIDDKVAATVVVTTSIDTLRGELRVAGTDVGDSVSAGEVRRLACGAGLLPLVLDGDSQPLDLGRQKRCFTSNQKAALAHLYDSCAAEGCERPFAWTELHHVDTWTSGGRTDLARAVPLCGQHHRWIERTDLAWTLDRDERGAYTIRFHDPHNHRPDHHHREPGPHRQPEG